MTTAVTQHMKLIGCGYVEMPQNGKRYKFHVERYVDDTGHEWANILNMEEIPDTGTMLIIPSLGVEASELEHMEAEYRWEQANPSDQELEWRDHRKQRKDHLGQWYRDVCDQRKAEANGNPRQFLVS